MAALEEEKLLGGDAFEYDMNKSIDMSYEASVHDSEQEPVYSRSLEWLQQATEGLPHACVEAARVLFLSRIQRSSIIIDTFFLSEEDIDMTAAAMVSIMERLFGSISVATFDYAKEAHIVRKEGDAFIDPFPSVDVVIVRNLHLAPDPELYSLLESAFPDRTHAAHRSEGQRGMVLAFGCGIELLPHDVRNSFAFSLQPMAALPDSFRRDKDGPLFEHDVVKALRQALSSVSITPAVQIYLRDVLVFLRQHAMVLIGPSKSGGDALREQAKAHALMLGSTFVRPQDVDAVAVGTQSHRLLLRTTNPWVETPHEPAHPNADAISRLLFARRLVNYGVFSLLRPPK